MDMDVTELCETNRHLPILMSRRVAATLPPHVYAEDLEPAAWDGLYRAAVSWRPGGGQPFRAWALWRIRDAIRDDLRRDDPITRHQRATQKRVADARDTLTSLHGRTPTDQAVAEHARLTTDQVRQARADMAWHALPAVSTDHDKWHTLPAPERDALEDDLHAWLDAAVAALPDRLAHVVAATYWHREEAQTIAADLGVSPSRVSQLRAEAHGMIRDALDWHIHQRPGPDLSPRPARARAAYRAAVAHHYRQGAS